jgi:hypothetical protein
MIFNNENRLRVLWKKAQLSKCFDHLKDEREIRWEWFKFEQVFGNIFNCYKIAGQSFNTKINKNLIVTYLIKLEGVILKVFTSIIFTNHNTQQNFSPPFLKPPNEIKSKTNSTPTVINNNVYHLFPNYRMGL